MTAPLRPIPNSYWVVPGRLLAGEYPAAQGVEAGRQRLRALLRAGIGVFVNLIAEDEEPGYDWMLQQEAERSGREAQYHRFGIPDFGVPPPEQMRRILDTLDETLAQGHNVYIHCWGGIGRTGTTVGCFLVRHGLSGDEALGQLAAWWQTVPKSAIFPRSPETDAQAAYIRQWTEPAPSSPR
jgi:rhodanese/phosphatase family protein